MRCSQSISHAQSGEENLQEVQLANQQVEKHAASANTSENKQLKAVQAGNTLEVGC